MTINMLSKYWWAIVLRGSLAVVFALILLIWTKDTLSILVIIFGLFVLIEGLISIFGAIGASKDNHSDWWGAHLRGLIGIIVGFVMLLWPIETVVVFTYMVALWALLMGVLEIWLSTKIVREFAGRSVVLTLGILSLLIGIIIFILPYGSLMTIIWIIGIFCLITGISNIIFGFQVKNLK